MALNNKIGIITCGLLLTSLGIVSSASAIEFDGEGLDADGGFHVRMVPPSNDSEKYTLNELIDELAPGWGITSGGEWNCNDDYTSCKLVYNGTEWTDEAYTIIYEYDSTVKTVIDSVIKDYKVPEGGFFINDAELMKYWAFGGDNLAAVSSKIKEALSNYNINLVVDVRGGGADPLMTHNIGEAKVFYNGTLYAVLNNPSEPTRVMAPHIFFVEDGSKDLMLSLMNRFVAIYGEEARDAVGMQATGQKVRDFVDSSDEFYDYFKDYLDAFVYEMNISQGQLGDSYLIAIVADSDKIETVPGVNSTDVLTNINIKTPAENMPGDTATYAENIGSEDEGMKEDFGDKFYAYEIGLYSASIDSMISDAEVGFTVSIPVPEILKDVSEISAFWKNFETGELEEHPATIVGDNAVFDTTHFSTYILAESRERPVEDEEEPSGEAEPEDDTVVPGAPDTGSKIGGISSVVASLPIFGAVFVATSVMVFVLSKRK